MELKKSFAAVAAVGSLCLVAYQYFHTPHISSETQQSSTAPDLCPREEAGGELVPPQDLFSQQGKLEVSMTYEIQEVNEQETRYCFKLANGKQSPTLHVYPDRRAAKTSHIVDQ